MRIEHLYGYDLSLLVVLAVLLEERSVTLAAQRLRRSQPAVSRALQRLRDLLGDPLFVREGGGLEPTPRALALREPLAQVLAIVDGQIFARDRFDPATDDRELRIVCADYAEGTILPRPLADLGHAAPRIDVVMMAAPRYGDTAALLRDEAHLAVGPLCAAGSASALRSVHLGHEGFAVLMRAGHPAADDLDLPTYVALPHVLVAPGGTPGGIVDQTLAGRGLRRRVAVRTRHFFTVPALLEASDRIATLPRRFADAVAERHGLVVREVPLDVPGFDVKLSWHERWQQDPGHRWLRNRLARNLRAEMAATR